MNITLDTCCFNLSENKELDFIFELDNKKKVKIFWADAFIHDIKTGQKEISTLPISQQEPARKRLQKASSFQEIKSWTTYKHPYNIFPLKFIDKELKEKIADILFPHRHEENGKYDEADVRHLYAHYVKKNDIFITKNKTDFVDNFRRDTLLSKFNIIIKTPAEFIDEWKKK